MASQLQQALRSLCFNTGWKYVVFWKLKHRSRMMFTWEDAYYEGNQYPDKNSTAGTLNEGSYSHDPLGLAVAKMSYQVYSLGEGVVGHVAVSGKHSWIFSDQHVVDSSFSSEYYGAWQTQFSAGIKTIAVVAVIPHGVVQLGSLHKIAEDVKLVDNIRNVFCNLQDSLAGCIPSSLKNTSLSDTCIRASHPAFRHCLAKVKGSAHGDEVNLWSQLVSPLGEPVSNDHILPPREGFSNKNLKMKMHESAECSISVNDILLPSSCENILKRQQQGEVEFVNNSKHVGESNGVGDSGKIAEVICTASIKNVRTEGSQMVTSNVRTHISSLQLSQIMLILIFQNFRACKCVEILQTQRPIRSNCVEMQSSPFSFCAGYELFEALGPSFQKQNDCIWEAKNIGSEMAVEISEGMDSCSLLMENSDMHLLDAVVAKASHKGADTESEISCRDTEESLLTAERTPCNSVGTLSSAGFSFDRDTSSSFNSVTCGVESLKGISPTSSSRGSEHVERSRVSVKISKKRARPGESCRPRPRDRQLIQDRIKELRELIPNGSKCSIDSLLERTIKHMIFMQSVTKHSEKLHKCHASKLLDKDTGMRKFSHSEQGSSWAVEVGNDQKVCPIIVENINMNGQMLVEMLCKECDQFLEIAEAIRSLGLSILKGVSEAYGNKAWMCFVVELIIGHTISAVKATPFHGMVNWK
ncbi:LOW QUALITY PROTEIN: transcription factor EMB1444-like [Salvia miltiorrhiza]|uniref:LOW QUALITY PROTEIN: transcription factor EMB1444-like n=1 Tax=Salvia miltiorrhiza TaxID=226208 RepID=UPI0025ABB162|nr:LOW QUALITY PROTEIN: transcription factor EMB1444-like [Salvia miltiorrhiza]